MRRSLEALVVVIALVAVPLGVAVVARSGPAGPGLAESALSYVQPLLVGTGSTATRCEWTEHHSHIDCTLNGHGSCSFDTTRHSGTCTLTKSNSESLIILFAHDP
jgi:hypothetical protein